MRVHANGVVQNVELAVGLFVLFLFLLSVLAHLLDAVHIRGINNLNFHRTELCDDRLYAVGVIHTLRQSLIEIVVGDVPLLLGQLDEVADFFLEGLMEVLRRDGG